MFQVAEKKDIKIGEIIIVGSLCNDKFVPVKATAKVEKITVLPGNITQIDLDWGSEFGKSKIFAHDEGKVWVRASNFN